MQRAFLHAARIRGTCGAYAHAMRACEWATSRERTELFPHVQGGLPPNSGAILQTMRVRRDAKGNFLQIEGLHEYREHAPTVATSKRRDASLLVLGACAGAAMAAAACRCRRS